MLSKIHNSADQLRVVLLVEPSVQLAYGNKGH